MSTEVETAVETIRAIDSPFEAAVGGRTADLIDTKAAIFRVVPWAGAWIAIATFVLLFLMFAIAFGLGVAVLVDAFIVRATLVPALMQMAGPANWWAPEWAKRIHDRFGIDESTKASHTAG